MSERVRPSRVAIVAGALVALQVFAVFLVRPVPDAVVAALGGPRGIDRIGGLRVRYRPPADVGDRELARYLSARSTIRRDGGVLVIDVPRATEGMAGQLIDVLASGGLAMREALEDDYAGAIARAAPLPDGVTVEVDMWRSDAGDRHTVRFLLAPTRALLDETVANARAAGWKPRPDAELVYEHAERYSRSHDEPAAEWRTYLLATDAAIDGTMIADAAPSYDPDTNRPVVLLDLTRDGASRFCEVTRRIVGHKLATVLGGDVRSAPFINGAICGGHVSITMGVGDPEHQEHERDALVAALRAGAVPRGGTVEAVELVRPASVALQEKLGAALLALAAGALAGLLVGFAVRVARPVRRRAPAPVAGPFPVRRLLVTLLAPIALYAGSRLMLPGINEVEIMHVLFRGRALRAAADPMPWSVLAVGWTPILTASVIVEVIALAVPKLRWRRHDPRGRVALGQAVAAVALALALVQGWFFAVYLEALSRGGTEVVDDPGLRFRLLTMVTLAAGTALLAVIAGMIREHGLGNGYAALALGPVVVRLVGPFFEQPYAAFNAAPSGLTPGLIALTSMIAATAALLHWRIAGGGPGVELRVPSSGIAPLSDGAGFSLLLAILAGLGLGYAFEDLVWRANDVAPTWLVLGLTVATIPIWSWLFARPAVIERVALQAGLAPPTREMWGRAALLSTVLLGGIGALAVFVQRVAGAGAVLATASGAVLGTATVLDIVADAHAHRRKLAPVGVLHQIQYAGVVERVLADAGIPCHIHAGNVRTLLAFFGPWAPAIVLVPEAHAADARRRIEDVLRSPSAEDRHAPERSGAG